MSTGSSARPTASADDPEQLPGIVGAVEPPVIGLVEQFGKESRKFCPAGHDNEYQDNKESDDRREDRGLAGEGQIALFYRITDFLLSCFFGFALFVSGV